MTSDTTASGGSSDFRDAGHDPLAPRPRRWWLLAIPGAIVVIGAGAVGLAQLRRSDTPVADPASAPTSSQAPNAAVDGPAAAPEDVTEPFRLFLPEPPEGFAMDWIRDPADSNPGAGVPPGYELIVLAKPGANLSTGGWLSITTRLMDRFERPRFDPAAEGTIQTPRAFTIGEYRAAGGTTWEGFESVVFGPVNDGFAVTVSGADIDQATLAGVAGLIAVDDNGQATLQNSPLLEGYETLGVFPNVFGLSNLSEGLYGLGTTSVNYSNPQDGSFMSLRSVAPLSKDPMAIARFFLKDPVDATVHGQPAIAGDIATVQPQPGQPAKAVWMEGGRVVTMFASMAPEELLTIAESSREATPDEWDGLKEEVTARMEKMNGMQEGPPTWLIGVGEMDNGATWVHEGGFNEDGTWISSTYVLSSFGPMMSGGGFGPGVEVTLPYLSVVPAQQMGIPDTEGWPTVLTGLLDAAQAEGAVLRFTPTGGGAPIEAPLRMIRPEWPAWAAAMAVPSGTTGSLEVVAFDGTVLDTKEVDETGSGDSVTVATVAVAAG